MTYDWNEVRPVIHQKIVVEGLNHNEVLEFLKEEPYNFNPGLRQFRKKLSQWDITRRASSFEKSDFKKRCLTKVIDDPSFHSHCLQKSVQNNDVFELKQLLTNDETCNRPSIDDMSLLHHAASSATSPQIFETLLEHGADVNQIHIQDGTKRTILQAYLTRLCKLTRSAKLRKPVYRSLAVLLQHGADIHPVGTNDRLPFDVFLDNWRTKPEWYLTMTAEERDCLGLILSKGAMIRTPFSSSLCVPEHSQSQSFQTFEHIALFHTKMDLSVFLVRNSSPIPGSSGSNLLNCLLQGCQGSNHLHPNNVSRLIEILLELRADPNSLDDTGRTPLMNILTSSLVCDPLSLTECIAKLVHGGADPCLRDRNGKRPIVYVAREFRHNTRLREELLCICLSGTTSVPALQAVFPVNDGWRSYVPGSPFHISIRAYFSEEDDAQLISKAAFNVSTWLWLDKRFMSGKVLDHYREIQHVLKLRNAQGLPDMDIPQAFVVDLLENNSYLQLDTPAPHIEMAVGIFQDDDPSYRCALCPSFPKVILQPWEMEQHYKEHKPFECETRHCGERFRTKEELDRHRYVQHTHPFECDAPVAEEQLCKLRFETEHELDLHFLTHPVAVEPHAGEAADSQWAAS